VSWLALRVAVPPELGDAVADLLVESGAPAVIREETRDGLVIEAHAPEEEHPRLRDALRAYLSGLEGAGSETTCETTPLPAIDWEATFRLHHRPIRIGRRLLVAPPWDVPESDGREVLVIEPGQAFGTGQHATTRGCLEEIEDAVASGVERALDVGTGSGILAAALVRLGVPRVVAVDCDPAVLPIARVNLARNGAARVGLLVGTADACRGRFDLVVANLLADAIVVGAASLAARTAAGGRLVLSGLLESQVARVAAAFAGWRVAAIRAEDEWRTVRLVREPGAC
jgi:ribosomal protein L11 methyltransferase